MELGRRLRRVALVALAAAGGYVMMRRRARRSVGAPAKPPRTVENFLRMLSERGHRPVVHRASTKGWIVEWEHGRSIYFPDE